MQKATATERTYKHMEQQKSEVSRRHERMFGAIYV